MIVRCALSVWRSWCDGFKRGPKGVSGCFQEAQPTEPGEEVVIPVDDTRPVTKIAVLVIPDKPNKPTRVKLVTLKVCQKRK